jgi:peptidoglycan/LPS O-acetylase OafA/YrhL
MPCAWTYLAFIFIMTSATHSQPLTSQAIWASLLCFRNYVDTSGIHTAGTGHFWSLSIEEQFYLFWPSVLILGGTRWARWLAAVGALGISLYRFHHWTNLSQIPLQATFGTQYRADALLVGCATALFLPVLRPYLRAWMSLPLLTALIWCATVFHRPVPLRESIIMAFLLALTTERLHPSFSRVLDWKPLALVGTLSYSLYIWQQPFLVSANSLPAFFIKILIYPVVALSSYYLIEEPLIRKGKEIARRLRISGAAPEPQTGSQPDPAPCVG